MTKPRARACKHAFTRLTFQDGATQQGLELDLELATNRPLLSAKCDDCGAQLSLGESDETQVAMEVRAAEIVTGDAPPQRFSSECFGWEDHQDRACDPGATDMETDAYLSGYLAYEIATHDHREARDAADWPWDVTRPVAGQYEGYAAEAALCDELVAELDAEKIAPPPADPVLQAAAARYLASDDGNALAAKFVAAGYEIERAADPDCRDEDDSGPRAPGVDLGPDVTVRSSAPAANTELVP